MLDPDTITALERMDNEGGLELGGSLARRLVRHKMAERREDDLLWITDYGLERLEQYERQRNMTIRGKRTDTERWECTGRRVGNRYSYRCKKCESVRMLAPNSVWLAQCPKCCSETHPAEAGREIGGFRLTGEVSRRVRRSEDRYTVECIGCGCVGRKTMWELLTKRNGCKRCSALRAAERLREERDLKVGSVHEHWEVMAIELVSRAHRKYSVRCTVCANEVLHTRTDVVDGVSCGTCALAERHRERDAEIMRTKFGPWTPVEKLDRRSTYGAQLWRFRCENGHERVTPVKNVKGVTYCLACHRGQTYSVGDVINGREVVEYIDTKNVSVKCENGHVVKGQLWNAQNHGCHQCHIQREQERRHADGIDG